MLQTMLTSVFFRTSRAFHTTGMRTASWGCSETLQFVTLNHVIFLERIEISDYSLYLSLSLSKYIYIYIYKYIYKNI